MRNRRYVLTAATALLAIALLSAFTLFYYRDNFATHLPARKVIADAWVMGDLPLWNPWIGGGQPLAGNPNVLAFYPTGALQLLFPLTVAFNLHFWIHLLAGAAGMYAFRRLQEASIHESSLTALLYVLSGPVISATAFYNLVTAVALIPTALAAAVLVLRSPSWRSGVLLGAVLGLFGLAAEPLIVLGTVVLLGAVATGRVARAHLPSFLLSAVVAAVVAAPQLIAFFEVAGEVSRTRFGYSTTTTLAASMHWWRVPEWLFGPVWGLATDSGPAGWNASAPTTQWPPFILQFTGSLLLVAAIARAMAEREWRWLAAGGALVFLALGSSNPILTAAVDLLPSIRIGRFPEKFTIHLAVVFAILVGRWFAAERHRRDLAITLAAALLAGLPIVLWLKVAGKPDPVLSQAGFWIVLATAAAVIAIRSERKVLRVAALLAPAATAAVMSIPIDDAAPYRSQISDDWPTTRITTTGNVPAGPEIGSSREHYRMMAALPVPHFGVISGVSYVLDRSPEGMNNASSRLLYERSRSGDVDRLTRWAAVSSASAVVDLNSVYRGLRVTRIGNPAPRVWSPSKLIPARTVADAVAAIEAPQFRPGAHAVVPPAAVAIGTGPVRLSDVTILPGRMRLQTSAATEAIVVTDQTYFTSWQARTASGTPLSTIPVNIDRLGIIVPQGDHVIEIAFGKYPRLIAGAWLLSWSLLIAAAALLTQVWRSSHGSAAPAR